MKTLIYVLSSLLLGCYKHELKRSTLECFGMDDVQQVKNMSDLKKFVLNGRSMDHLVPLKKGVLQRFPNLENAEFSHLNEIEPGFLDGLNEMTLFSTDFSAIQEIKPYTFANSKLEGIVIDNSQLEEIHPHAFDNAPNLKGVMITGNNVYTIKAGVFNNFKNLSMLYLASNNIKYIEEGAFFGIKNLEYLRLNDNKLQSFSSRKTFGHNDQLLSLELPGNKLTEINKDMFVALPNLRHVDVRENAITTIEEGSFVSLSELRYLDLSENMLKELRADIFPPSSTLNTLFLNNNSLSYIEPEVLNRLPKLKTISLENNPWKCACYKEVEFWVNLHNVTHLRKPTKSETYCDFLSENDYKCHYNLEKSQYAH